MNPLEEHSCISSRKKVLSRDMHCLLFNHGAHARFDRIVYHETSS